jgi:hypothetical protein
VAHSKGDAVCRLLPWLAKLQGEEAAAAAAAAAGLKVRHVR